MAWMLRYFECDLEDHRDYNGMCKLCLILCSLSWLSAINTKLVICQDAIVCQGDAQIISPFHISSKLGCASCPTTFTC